MGWLSNGLAGLSRAGVPLISRIVDFACGCTMDCGGGRLGGCTGAVVEITAGC